MIGAELPDGRVRELASADSFYKDPAGWIKSSKPGDILTLAQHDLRPPLPSTSRVLCVGLNYKAHAAEVGQPWPEQPVIFARWGSTLTTDGSAVPLAEERFDWEGELAVIVGLELRDATEQEASEAILGYAPFNDLSARTWQMLSPQWTLGKCSDSSAPIGSIITRDQALDPAAGMRLKTRVNGEVVQDSTTADMIFSVPKVLSFVSRIMTLRPGDVIATGTPAGVGIGLKPPRFLQAGDEVDVEIETLGKVSVRIVPRNRKGELPMRDG